MTKKFPGGNPYRDSSINDLNKVTELMGPNRLSKSWSKNMTTDNDTRTLAKAFDTQAACSSNNSKETKYRITIRLDKDVMEHFKGEDPKGYQSRINAALKAYMKAQKAIEDATTDILVEGLK